MEHPCPRCNSAVEDGSPFCSSCGAAQVRFSAGEGTPTRIGVAVPDAGNVLTLQGGSSQTRTIQSRTLQAEHSRATIRAALYAGMIAAVLSTIPVAGNFLLALPLAGFLSVLFYRRWSQGVEPQPAAGFKLGALTGVFGFVGFLVITAIGTLSSAEIQNSLRQSMLQAIQVQQARATDPQVQQMFDYLKTSQGMTFLMVLGFACMGVIFVLLSGSGAAISAWLLRRKAPPQQ